jgi:RsiW-degrading membrane proteinase PrsW (M82 family)
MKGWELKPLGALVLVALLILFTYLGYKFVKRHQTPEGESPTD